MSRAIEGVMEAQIRARISEAVTVVRKSLDASRNPRHAGDVPHTYTDKFRMVELASRAALAAQLNALNAGFGLTDEKIALLLKQRGKKTVSLRLSCSTTCDFVKTTTRDEKSATRHEVKTGIFKTTHQTVTTITEHFWKYTVGWRVEALVGTGQEFRLELSNRTGSHTLMTRSKEPVNPLPEKQALTDQDVEITFLLNAVAHGDGEQTTRQGVEFSVDRASSACHTPRRNAEVDQLLRQASHLRSWAERVSAQVQRVYRAGFSKLLPIGESPPNFDVINAEVFVPVAVMLALEEDSSNSKGDGGEADSPASVFSPADFETILSQQQDDLRSKFAQMQEVLPADGVVTPTEGQLVLCASYSSKVWRQYAAAVQDVEQMLMEQLISALGERIGPKDFAKYMNFHNRQLYRPEFAPRGFCYAVRRPDHYPEGVLSIEDGDNQPVPTTCLHRPSGHEMKFALSAAVEVAFRGEHFVHSAVFHKFSNSPSPSLKLIARARQFSSFILMIGSLNSADVFAPEHALIIQNKDELTIPLLLETIPAPQEFRDAIESLSPEQQAFCKAYRKMQLAGSLFAVAVVQIKPQLEKLLNLPHDSLTKEVKMCQDLMSLFIEYQIPSDLLSYAGPEKASPDSKVAAVKGYIAAIHSMLEQSKQEELEEERKRYEKAHPIIPAAPEPHYNGKGSVHFLSGGMSRSRMSAQPSMASAPRMMAPMAMPAPGGARPPPPRAAAAISMPSPPPPAPMMKHDGPQNAFPTPSTPSKELTRPDTATGGTSSTSDGQSTDGISDATPSPVGLRDVVDYTTFPSKLDKNFDQYDKFNALRATKVKLGSAWRKTFQRGLLSKPQTESVSLDAQRKERSRAFDLLDALSKSGGLTLSGCTLHIVLAATHCFDLDLLNTVVQDNINPIERVETSNLIMAATIFGQAAQSLVLPHHAARLADAELPGLLEDKSAPVEEAKTE